MRKQPNKQETFCIWLENQSKVESSRRLFFEFFLNIFEKSSFRNFNKLQKIIIQDYSKPIFDKHKRQHK